MLAWRRSLAALTIVRIQTKWLYAEALGQTAPGQSRISAGQGHAALECHAAGRLQARGVRPCSPLLRVGAGPVVRGGRVAARRTRPPFAAHQADNDEHGSPGAGSRAGQAAARSAGRSRRARLADRGSPAISA